MKPAVTKTQWIVKVGNKTLHLTESQFNFVRKMSEEGKNTVWFEEFVISIPHISYMEKETIIVQPFQPDLPDLTLEEQARAKQKLDEIRQRWPKNKRMRAGLTSEEEEVRRQELLEEGRKLFNE